MPRRRQDRIDIISSATNTQYAFPFKGWVDTKNGARALCKRSSPGLPRALLRKGQLICGRSRAPLSRPGLDHFINRDGGTGPTTDLVDYRVTTYVSGGLQRFAMGSRRRLRARG
jgi:hypothetical protein